MRLQNHCSSVNIPPFPTNRLRLWQPLIGLWVILSFILAGCQSAQTPGVNLTPEYSSTVTKQSTPTQNPRQSTATATPAPIIPTPALAPLLPSDPLLAVSPENASRLVEQARIGDGRLQQIALSPDGYTLAVASLPGISLLNAGDLSLIKWINSTEQIHSLAYSPDGKILAVGMGQRKLVIMDASSGEILESFAGHTWEVNCLAFSPDGKTLLSGSMDKTIRLWGITDGQKLRTFGGQTESITSAGFTPDGTAVFSASLDGSILIWRISDGKQLFKFNPKAGRTLSAKISPDGKWLAAGFQDGTVHLWSLSDGKEEAVLSQPAGKATDWEGWQRTLAFSPDSTRLAAGGGSGIIYVWDVKTHQAVGQYQGMPSIVSLVYSSGGKTITAGSQYNNLRQVDAATGKLTAWRDTQGFQSGITSLVFSPDGGWFAAGSLDGEIRLEKVNGPGQTVQLVGSSEAVSSLSYSSDGVKLVSGSVDGSMRIWSVPEGILTQTIQTKTRIRGLVLSPDGKTIAECSELDKAIRLWDVQSGKVVKTLTGHKGPVETLFYSLDGKTLFSGSGDHNAILWDLQSGKPVKTYKLGIAVLSVAQSADGKNVAIGLASQLTRVLQISDGKSIANLYGHKDQIFSVSFFPSGNILATSSADGRIGIWDLTKPKKPLVSLQGHAGTADVIAVSPDGTLLISGGEDGTIRVWGVIK